ncbi:hypothetical protein BDV59DRAFT_102109 [Aspergillus ambiguus]|uniref:uncharacterized protein n=1 Tax=Aspergillus ambiguus TaxID=176160 RepID=UPI003CCD6671
MSPRLAWIWPKDPRPGNPSHWPRIWRLRDVLTNRGPDIYIGRINTGNDRKVNWSRWPDDADNERTSCCCGEQSGKGKRGARTVDKSPMKWDKRHPAERYDFRTRKYAIPDRGTWSRVEYCDGGHTGGRRCEKHAIPVRYWDLDGREYPACCWHDGVYGDGCRR